MVDGSRLLICLRKYTNEKLERREPAFRLRRALVEVGVSIKCAWCSITNTYNGNPIVLHIDHVDGNFKNNTLENLRFLCPNYHSQTSTFGNKTRKGTCEVGGIC